MLYSGDLAGCGGEAPAKVHDPAGEGGLLSEMLVDQEPNRLSGELSRATHRLRSNLSAEAVHPRQIALTAQSRACVFPPKNPKRKNPRSITLARDFCRFSNVCRIHQRMSKGRRRTPCSELAIPNAGYPTASERDAEAVARRLLLAAALSLRAQGLERV